MKTNKAAPEPVVKKPVVELWRFTMVKRNTKGTYDINLCNKGASTRKCCLSKYRAWRIRRHFKVSSPQALKDRTFETSGEPVKYLEALSA